MSPHVLPAPFSTTSATTNTSASNTASPVLVTQGAEALVYRTTFLSPNTPCALKYRPPKPYRHPTLDKRLTRARILAEARVLVRCGKDGVNVPGVLGLDWEAGWVALEWVRGCTVRRCLDWWFGRRRGGGVVATGPETGVRDREQGHSEQELDGLMRKIGLAVGKLHACGVVHGDLTTSNLMLRPPRLVPSSAPGLAAHDVEEEELRSLDGEIVLIDFGLAQQSIQEEDKAVDLYVLERAFGSTHPEAEAAFKDVLKAYGDSYKGAKIVLKRLEDVRMRGRKKSMIG